MDNAGGCFWLGCALLSDPGCSAHDPLACIPLLACNALGGVTDEEN
jgi:hypothetical protein